MCSRDGGEWKETPCLSMSTKDGSSILIELYCIELE